MVATGLVFLLEHLLGLICGLGGCQGRAEQLAITVGETAAERAVSLNQLWDRQRTLHGSKNSCELLTVS